MLQTFMTSYSEGFIFVYEAIAVEIGLHQSLYYVDENSGTVYICTGVLSGRTAGRSFYVLFRTLDGDAVGMSL